MSFSINRTVVASEVIEDLARRYPARAIRVPIYEEGRERIVLTAVRFECRDDDPELREAVRILHDLGVRPWNDRSRDKPPNEVMIHFFRKYTEAERRKVELFEFNGLGFCGPEWNHASGDEQRLIDVQKLPKRDFGSLGHSMPICSTRARSIIEEAGMRGFRFFPLTPAVRVKPWNKYRWEPTQWPEGVEPWWLIEAETVLPRTTSPHILYRDNRGRPIPDDAFDDDRWMTGGFLFEFGYVQPQFRYREADLAEVGEFDIAESWERVAIGWLHRWHRMKIVSQRFYALAARHKLRGSWVPVRIERPGDPPPMDPWDEIRRA